MADYSDLLIWQYKDKPKAKATVEGLCAIADNTRRGLLELMEVFDLDSATGAQLDLIGLHVGLSRFMPGLAPVSLFAFVPNPKGFGKAQKVGGRFWRKGAPLRDSARLGDEDYRFLLKAVIAKYNSSGNIIELQEALEALLGFRQGTVHDQQDMSVTVNVYKELTEFEKYVLVNLDMLPRPPAVRIKRITQMAKKTFGFIGSKNAAPMGQGKFARIIL